MSASTNFGMKTLTGKHALITGGSRGIGLAIARALAADGASITLVARDRQQLRAARDELAAVSPTGFVVADVTTATDVEKAFDLAERELGEIHILINNAGAAESAPFIKTNEALWDRLLATNLGSVYHCTQRALPAMLAAGWGRIINTASTAGLKGYPYVSAYCAAKHGVVGLTRALALEVASRGVTVNAICPGYTETELLDRAVANIVGKTGRSREQAKASLAQHNPMGKLVLPQQVAGVARWLCQEDAGAVTGQAIAVDGGETA